jgi:hypothetical protein
VIQAGSGAGRLSCSTNDAADGVLLLDPMLPDLERCAA